MPYITRAKYDTLLIPVAAVIVLALINSVFPSVSTRTKLICASLTAYALLMAATMAVFEAGSFQSMALSFFCSSLAAIVICSISFCAHRISVER